MPEHGGANDDAILAVVESVSEGGDGSDAKHKTNKTLVCAVVSHILQAPTNSETTAQVSSSHTRSKKPWRRAGRLLKTVGMVLDMCVISLMQLLAEDSVADMPHAHDRDDHVMAERVQKLKDGIKKNTDAASSQDEKKKRWFLRVSHSRAAMAMSLTVIHSSLTS
jgi:hypothetical protein